MFIFSFLFFIEQTSFPWLSFWIQKRKKKRKWNMHMYCVLCSVFICLFSHKILRFVMELIYCTCQAHWRLWFLHKWRYYIANYTYNKKKIW
jgi:hypothetical protein